MNGKGLKNKIQQPKEIYNFLMIGYIKDLNSFTIQILGYIFAKVDAQSS